MAKYKVGDIIIIKSDLNINKHYGSHYVTKGMLRMKNDCAIREISKLRYGNHSDFNVYQLKDQYNYTAPSVYWTADMFEGLYMPIEVSTDDLMAFLGE